MTNIFFGKTNEDCLCSLLLELKKNYSLANSHHVFVVPDRMSVICEKRIFEFLGIESTCNIEVLTLSRLASRIAYSGKIISRTTSVMLLQKILSKFQRAEEKKLKCFTSKSSIDLADSIYGTISQFKSCGISPEDVCINTEDEFLKNKLYDIALLYKEYESQLRELGIFDSMDRLGMAISEIKNKAFIKNTNFYVSNFDSFTYQGYEMMREIASNCKHFNIGIANSDNPANNHIYNQNYVQNILTMTKKPNVFYANEQNSGDFKFIQDNLFSFSLKSVLSQNDNLCLFEGQNLEQELEWACSHIKNKIINENYSASDFFISIPNLDDSKHLAQKVLSKYGFDFYVDCSENFYDSILVRFVKSFFEFIDEKSAQSIINLIKNPLFDIDFDKIEDFEDYVLKYNLENFYDVQRVSVQDEFYQNFEVVRSKLLGFEDAILEFEKASTYEEFSALTQKLLENLQIFEKIQTFVQNFAQSQNLYEARIFSQFYNSFIELLQNILSVLGKENCDKKEFLETLLCGCQAVNLSSTPLSIDAIFVGDSSASFYERRKIGFILDCSESHFPHQVTDCGMISDSDIDALSEKYKLEPSIAQINKKERFKAFELLLTPSEKLFVSYNVESGERSKIFSDLSQMFLQKNGTSFCPIKINKFSDSPFDIQNASFDIAKFNLTLGVRSVLDGEKEYTKEDEILYSSLKNFLPKNYAQNFTYKNKPKLTTNIFFPKESTSVSQIETFMKCPFLHFVQKGLKLKEKEEGILSVLDVGTFMHAIAENLLKKVELPIDENVLEQKVKEIFDEEIAKSKYASLSSNSINQTIIKNLLDEAKRFSMALNNQSKVSSFKPTYFEARFDDSKTIKSLKIKSQNKIISLTGSIDRIDVFKDYFRIIDYKTGSCSLSLEELFFGKKIQLEAYVKTVENSLNLKPAGFYYQPLPNAFGNDKTSIQKLYRLKGATLEDSEIIFASDNSLSDGESSDVINVRINKDGSFKKEGISLLSSSEISKMSSYSLNLIKKACDDIQTLDITPFPVSSICKNCAYKTLCRFDENFGNSIRDIKGEIDMSIIEKGGE